MKAFSKAARTHTHTHTLWDTLGHFRLTSAKTLTRLHPISLEGVRACTSRQHLGVAMGQSVELLHSDPLCTPHPRNGRAPPNRLLTTPLPPPAHRLATLPPAQPSSPPPAPRHPTLCAAAHTTILRSDALPDNHPPSIVFESSSVKTAARCRAPRVGALNEGPTPEKGFQIKSCLHTIGLVCDTFAKRSEAVVSKRSFKRESWSACQPPLTQVHGNLSKPRTTSSSSAGHAYAKCDSSFRGCLARMAILELLRGHGLHELSHLLLQDFRLSRTLLAP